jgi:hypothetical protein
MKRKAITQGQGSSSIRPCFAPPQGTPARAGGGQQSYQPPAQQTPQTTTQTPRPRQAAPTGSLARPAGQSTTTVTTFLKCGEVGHYANACPKRNPNTPARSNVWGKNRLQLATRGAVLQESTKSVLKILLMVLILLSVRSLLIQFLQLYYLILELRICSFLLVMSIQMSYLFTLCKNPW